MAPLALCFWEVARASWSALWRPPRHHAAAQSLGRGPLAPWLLTSNWTHPCPDVEKNIGTSASLMQKVAVSL
eukprot:9408521-Pyramimonas_sp.AAC.1